MGRVIKFERRGADGPVVAPLPTALKCHHRGCKRAVGFIVRVYVNRGGLRGLELHQMFYTCRLRDHQYGNRVAGWAEPAEETVRDWSLLGMAGVNVVTPLARRGE